jgi:hypothetical protein
MCLEGRPLNWQLLSMILKERDSTEHTDRNRRDAAGRKAEEQLAFYLRRDFAESKSIWIFNDLRFRDSTADVAQIDHLALHKHGFIVIESKSVTSEVTINERGEWSRKWNGQEQGISSPIAQAQRQMTFLQRALANNVEQLMGKLLGLQKQVGGFSWKCLVAISDSGRVHRPKPMDYPEVVKADLIPERIWAIYDELHKLSNVFSLKGPSIFFTSDEMERIAQFLIEHHCPLEREQATRKSSPVQQPKPPAPTVQAPAAPVGFVWTQGVPCPGCQTATQLTWGRYGYYWKCPSCAKNTPLPETCAKCGKKPYLRKDGNRYFARCETCGTKETLYAELG